MSLLFPNSKSEETAASWFLALFFIGPLILLTIFYWRAYFSIEAHVWSFETGAALSIPLFMLLIYRARRLKLKGFSSYATPGLGQYLVGLVAFAFSLYGWVLVLWAGVPILTNGNTQTLYLRVSEMSECTGNKCVMCRYRVKSDQWFGVSTSNLCVNRETWNTLHVGDRIKIEAYSSPHSLYVLDIRRG